MCMDIAGAFFVSIWFLCMAGFKGVEDERGDIRRPLKKKENMPVLLARPRYWPSGLRLGKQN